MIFVNKKTCLKIQIINDYQVLVSKSLPYGHFLKKLLTIGKKNKKYFVSLLNINTFNMLLKGNMLNSLI